MIPKKIHYCWFGRGPKPKSALDCIESWKRFFPDYEIKEWNEDNFDVRAIPYTAQAYEAGKYAFVSDYARFKILYEQGGLYFDTDVEAIRPFDDIVADGPFMGFEINPCAAHPHGAVNPGLGMGAEPGMEVYEKILRYYSTLCFVLPDGSLNITDAVVNITTRELRKMGLGSTPGIQYVAGTHIYPADYFNPLDDATGRLIRTSNTRSIHWYSKTWMKVSPLRQWASRIYHRLFGVNSFSYVRKTFRALFRK